MQCIEINYSHAYDSCEAFFQPKALLPRPHKDVATGTMVILKDVKVRVYLLTHSERLLHLRRQSTGSVRRICIWMHMELTKRRVGQTCTNNTQHLWPAEPFPASGRGFLLT